MVWTLDMDDFSGKFCKNGTFPVVRTLKQCFDTPPTTTTTKTTPTTTTSSFNTTTENAYSDIIAKSSSNSFFNLKHIFLITSLVLLF